MKRHSQNQNLIIHEGSDYSGMPVQVSKGPFVKQYLEKLSGTMELALKQYSRVLAFRVDLRLPKDVELPECVCMNDVISKFLASFKAKIQHNREKARKEKKYAHDTLVRFVWAREIGGDGRPHFHVAILLNYDAFKDGLK